MFVENITCTILIIVYKITRVPIRKNQKHTLNKRDINKSNFELDGLFMFVGTVNIL